ncbi:acyl carrier protein [Streptomyces sp. ASQP_92]|uniref:acyl carrier protein n=1 Tax=Streptomyces sp. ASQP_92 TaxID=2979116 RepID=UPI0021C16C07|nr:acyl carrier protein [Streptomyces sp. ASQP_92]MCT9089608.1 acyl carrier protein [Streptomyces sp. ASQP_92]
MSIPTSGREAAPATATATAAGVTVTVTERQVADHLTQLLAEHLQLDHDLIDQDVPLSAYGIDSMAGTWLTRRLGERCGVSIDRALLVHRPSVTEVAQDVVAALAARGTAGPRDSVGSQDGPGRRGTP